MKKLITIITTTLLLPCAVFAQQNDQLTFDEAAKLMLSANPQAMSAESAAQASYNRYKASRAGLYPQLQGAASYARGGQEWAIPDESYSYGLSLTQPIFSPELPAAARSSAASWEKAQAEYNLTKTALFYELRIIFADLEKSRNTLKLSEETLKRRAENVEIIRIKYEAGRENKTALLETQSVYKTAVWQNEKYKKDQRLLERKLNRLLGREPMVRVNAAAPADPLPPAEDFSGYSKQLEQHPSLKAAQAALKASEAELEKAKSGYLPTLDAIGRYNKAGFNWPDTTDNWSAGVNLALPLFTGGKTTAAVRGAKSDRAGVLAKLKNTRDGIYLTAEDMFLSLKLAWAYIDVSKTAVEAANARAWLLRKQYLAGQAAYFEWRNVEDQLINEENQLVSAKRELAAANAAFVQALGE